MPAQTTIKGLKINGDVYPIDYETLANKPFNIEVEVLDTLIPEQEYTFIYQGYHYAQLNLENYSNDPFFDYNEGDLFLFENKNTGMKTILSLSYKHIYDNNNWGQNTYEFSNGAGETLFEIGTEGSTSQESRSIHIKQFPAEEDYTITFSIKAVAVQKLPKEFVESELPAHDTANTLESDTDYLLSAYNNELGWLPVRGILSPPVAADAGKVLTADDQGGYSWEDAPSGGTSLPSFTGHNGDLLAVNSTGNGVKWVDQPEGIPSYANVENGQILIVNSTGDGLKWTNRDGVVGPAVLMANSDGDPTWLATGTDHVNKILGVNYNEQVEWYRPEDLIQSELPDITNNASKMLVVNETGTGLAWVNQPSPGATLPSYANNANKVLAVDSTGTGIKWIPQKEELPSLATAGSHQVLGIDNTGAEDVLTWVGADKFLPALENSGSYDLHTKFHLALETGENNNTISWKEDESAQYTIPTASSQGLILVSDSDSLKWSDDWLVPATNTRGLILVSNCGNATWEALIPEFDTVVDRNKVLTVTSTGPRWVLPS